MKKYNYIIIDDDDIDRIAVNFYLKNYPFLEHRVSFSNANDAFSYLENNSIDLIFLDIDMPGMNGLEFQGKMKSDLSTTIFITSHPEFAVEGFELEAFDYIVKPIKEERIDKCIKRLEEYLKIKLKAKLFENSFKEGAVMVKQGRDITGIKLNEIVYIEALKDYSRLITFDGKTVTIHGNLAATLRNENFSGFIRVHRSFAVQKNYINLIRTSEIVLNNEAVIPLGLHYRENLINALS